MENLDHLFGENKGGIMHRHSTEIGNINDAYILKDDGCVFIMELI